MKDNSKEVPKFVEVATQKSGGRTYRCKACGSQSGLLHDGTDLSAWIARHRTSHSDCFKS